ncbi:MAG: amidohydrolase family protein [Verrucomicrobia bacterium]|nr:amidohydrolase family protein [Verrucomicrobiota bacterium]
MLVRDGKIVEVGKKLTAPGAKQVDLKGLHLFPGLIASSTSLGLVEIDAVRATRDTTEVGEFHPEVRSWLSVNPDSELLAVARANGITHFVPAPQGGVISGQSGLLALDGWTMEEMTIKKPVALHVFWPRMDLDTSPRSSNPNAKSLDEQSKDRAKRLRELDEFFADARAYAKAMDAAKNGAPSPRTVPAWEAMLPYVRGEVPLMVHADDMRQIKSAVTWAATNKFKLILAGGLDAWMLADLLATNNVPVIYERTFNMSFALAATPLRDTVPYDAQFSAPEKLRAAGVKVIFNEGIGGDATANARNIPYSAAQAVAFGLPLDEGLRGITLYPAQVLGVADRLGSIEAGKEATFFAATGHILDIRSQVKRMWIAGKEVSLETRHTRLYEKYNSRPQPK